MFLSIKLCINAKLNCLIENIVFASKALKLHITPYRNQFIIFCCRKVEHVRGTS